MGEGVAIPRSLIEQILDETFTSIKGQEEFDQQTIQKLKQLATRGDLKKPREVTKAISSTQGGAP